MENILSALRGAAEQTRLQILALCACGDLTVSELVRILGQSQPRVSRHLRILCEAGLLIKFPEAGWVFHRLVQDGPGAALIHTILEQMPLDDEQLTAGFARLEEIKAERRKKADDYFRKAAPDWERIRRLHVDEKTVEATMREMLPPTAVRVLLDIGTGTGRVLEIYGPNVERAEGIDLSPEMLTVARTTVDQNGLTNCGVRRGDMYRIPHRRDTFDATIIHQVLHFADAPGRVITEAARVLSPGGQLLIVDFAPHGHEALRAEHHHRRLGFEDQEIEEWMISAGLGVDRVEKLPGDSLTVVLWHAVKPGGVPSSSLAA